MNRLWRAFARTASPVVVPTLRLPTAVVPGHPISLPILSDLKHERPKAGAVTPPLAQELLRGRRQIALLADGACVGVIAQIQPPHPAAEPGKLLHVVGQQRVRLIGTEELTPAGGRLVRFAPFDDELLPIHTMANSRAILGDEVSVARSLLKQRVRDPNRHEWSLTLCTLYPDTNILPWTADPTTHPLWHRTSTPPKDASEFSFWLASRLPLTTQLRLHVLATACPLRRMIDLVAAMRLLAHPDRRCRQARGPDGAALAVRWRSDALPQMVVDIVHPDQSQTSAASDYDARR